MKKDKTRKNISTTYQMETKSSRYVIDQSGKIEQTNNRSVIAYSNSTKYAILIPAKLKRQLHEIFRIHGFTVLDTYYVFSVGVYYLLANLNEKSIVTIDTEYPGKDKIIKKFITTLLEKNNKPSHEISFARIGNRPPAHYAAKDVFDKKKKPNKILTLEEFIKALKKTDGRLRECLPTLVGAQARSIKRIYQKRSKKSRGRK